MLAFTNVCELKFQWSHLHQEYGEIFKCNPLNDIFLMWRKGTAWALMFSQSIACSPTHPFKIRALLWVDEPSHWLHMQDKVQKQLYNFRALTDSFVVLLLVPAQADLSISTGCIQSFVCSGWVLLGFIRHWSMEMGRVWVSQDFLSLRKLDLPSALRLFHLWAYVWRRQERVLGGGVLKTYHFAIEVFHLHIQYRWRKLMSGVPHI